MVKWTVSLPNPRSASATTLDGTAPSFGDAAHALVGTAREFARTRQREPHSGPVMFSIDSVTRSVTGILDPTVPTSAVVREVIDAVTTSTTRSQEMPRQQRSEPTEAGCAVPGVLNAQLDRIHAWASRHLRQNAFIPADPADIDTVQRNWSVTLPTDLVELFSRAGGGSPLPLLPGLDWLSIFRSGEVRAMWLAIGADHRERFPEFAAAFDPMTLSAELAGSSSELFLPEFIPIADRDGTTLFVDTRGGDRFGCVGEYSAEGAAQTWPWPSVAHMVTNLAESLDNGTSFLGNQPVISSHALTWQRTQHR